MDSHEVRHAWANRSGEYSPAYYAHYGSDATSELVREVIETYVGSDASVLEVGCSSGRHLAHLADHGFDDLAGIELNAEAFRVMEETYPDLARTGTFHHAAIADVVDDFSDGAFDAVYSVETLQHVHPDTAWIFAELARITDDLLVTVENEGTVTDEESDGRDVNYVNGEFPLYYRNWNRIFTDLGFVEVEAESTDRDTARAFRSA